MSGRVGQGVDTQSTSDEGACAVAVGMLKAGTTAEVWDGIRLVKKVSVAIPAFRNHLLHDLPDHELQHIQASLHPVKLVLEQVLHEVGNPIDDVFFLESGVVSLVARTGDDGAVGVGMTGQDGFVGIPALLNPRPSAIHRAVVQVPGNALRIAVPALREAITHLPRLRDRCLRYVQCMMAQTAQLAACNARHGLPQRLARWLLMAHDRSDGNEVPMTQAFLGSILGVRRAGVSVAATALEAKGLVRQSRGKLTIVDRSVLGAQACSCYRLIEDSRHNIMAD